MPLNAMIDMARFYGMDARIARLFSSTSRNINCHVLISLLYGYGELLGLRDQVFAVIA